jgi:Domain of unknown function (DUF4190)
VPAILSLILGILGCVPFITGLFAVILGIVGIRKTRDPHVGGKGFAIAGIILGLISMTLWGLFGGGLYAAYVYGKPAREAAKQFAVDLASGNLDAAQARCTATISREDLTKAAENLKSLGAVQDTTFLSFNQRSTNGVTTFDLGGVAHFKGHTLPYLVRLVKEGDTFKVDGFTVGDRVAVGTTPTPSSGSSFDD